MTTFRSIRLLLATGAVATASIFAFGAAAQDAVTPTLVLRPHCDEADQTLCSMFPAHDPSSLMTPNYSAGERVDIDVVLMNPTQDAVANVRIWLSYDPKTLSGETITVSPVFPTAIPGEMDFAPQSGYVKIAATADEGAEPMDAIIPIARLTFIVQASADSVTPITFYDPQMTTDGHTYVETVFAPGQNLTGDVLGSLLVNLTPSLPPPAASSVPSPVASSVASSIASSVESSVSSSAASSSVASSVMSASSVAGNNVFALLQVQNMQAGTKDNQLIVAWDSISHPRLQGYNVYYGTEPGRYLQRRSVSVAARGTVIRDLPNGTTYYVAVSAVDDKNQESVFSKEASVEIGNPATASAPITGDLDAIGSEPESATAPENPLENTDVAKHGGVPGDTGLPTALVILMLGSAAMGTLFACRRQLTAATHLP